MHYPLGEGRPWAALFVPAGLDGETLDLLCEALTKTNERFLREHPEVPPLYWSGAYYKLQPELWISVPWALERVRQGLGLDCKVLAAWRAAEMRVREGDRNARCVWSRYRTHDKLVYHIKVRRGDGTEEDPSALLGMRSPLPGGHEWTRSPYRLLAR